MAPRIEAAKKHREAFLADYPQVSEVYDGFYLRLEGLSAEGSRYFLSAAAIIGSRLTFDGENAQLLGLDNVFLAQVTGASAERLAKHVVKGWHVEVLLSAIYFSTQDKSAVVDLAFLCWDPTDAELDTALTAFTKNIADRFTAGDRASLKLSQDQFIKVLQSKGAWYLTPTTKREPLGKGLVVYKARRSGTERTTGYALKHRLGCTVMATLFWIVLVGVIVYLVWFFFFR